MKTAFNLRHRGSGMVLGFFVLTVLFILGMSIVSFTTSSLILSKHDIIRTRALSCAEAGIDLASSYIMTGQYTSGDAWYTTTVADDETCRIHIMEGSGITEGKLVVISAGTVNRGSIGITRTIKAILDLHKDNVNVWNNAIFADMGQSGRSINGNVIIRGSVHLLGDGETYTDLDGDGHWDDNESYTDKNKNGQYDLGEPYTDTDHDGHRDAREPFIDVNGNGTRDDALDTTDMATEVSGTANIGNNYNGMPSDLSSRIPPLNTTSYGGEMVQSLDAKLRVKHGKISISGSATVGDPNITGDSTKETLDGVFVNDGYGGNKGSSSVYSDNGTANGYDLADGLVTFPVIDNGSYTNNGTTYTNYLSYLKANATVYSGNLSITKGTALTLTGPNGTMSIDASGNMTVSGVVYVTGDITFGPSKSRIYYSGSGTLVTPQSVYSHCDILPKTRFPDTDALGVIAGDRVELATGSGDAQLTMALAMYAQHKIISSKQNQIAGTMVSSYFQMSNVPSLYQVPELAQHLPPRMPGGDPIWIVGISVESWQEI